MYNTIVLECQTLNFNGGCEDCPAVKKCKVDKKYPSAEVHAKLACFEEFLVPCQ
jgi:hypothetical protein